MILTKECSTWLVQLGSGGSRVAGPGGDGHGGAAASDDDDDQTRPPDGDNGGTVIGFVGALTGDNANLGINIRDGIKLAVDEANARRARELELKEFDTAGDPAQASTVKDQFINDNSDHRHRRPAVLGRDQGDAASRSRRQVW